MSSSTFREGLSQLRDPGVARLFGARLVSSFGTAMAPIAMAFGVLELTGSASDVGLVIASQTGSQVLVQLFGGALADRWSRKRVIVAADLLAAASQATMAALLFSGTAQVAELCALMAINGVSFALHWPAQVGLVPQVVERENLQPANALLSLAQSGAYGLGGAAAGLIVALAGAEWAIATDAGTFLLSALLIAQLKPRAQQRSERQNLLRDIIDGWKEFTSHRWLWTIVAQWSLMMAGWSGCFFVVGPIVAARSLGGPSAWGWIAGAFGAGLVLGGLLGIRIAVRRPMLVGTLGVLCLTIPVSLLALAAPVPWIAAGAFVAGAGLELFGVLWFTALHTHVAPEALSRVSAYDILGSIALAPIGQAAAGPLIDLIGAPRTLWLGVAMIAIPTLLVLGVREVRELESS